MPVRPSAWPHGSHHQQLPTSKCRGRPPRVAEAQEHWHPG
jgi:hypothetical protein